jgi:hypothetical protein
MMAKSPLKVTPSSTMHWGEEYRQVKQLNHGKCSTDTATWRLSELTLPLISTRCGALMMAFLLMRFELVFI